MRSSTHHTYRNAVTKSEPLIRLAALLIEVAESTMSMCKDDVDDRTVDSHPKRCPCNQFAGCHRHDVVDRATCGSCLHHNSFMNPATGARHRRVLHESPVTQFNDSQIVIINGQYPTSKYPTLAEMYRWNNFRQLGVRPRRRSGHCHERSQFSVDSLQGRDKLPHHVSTEGEFTRLSNLEGRHSGNQPCIW